MNSERKAFEKNIHPKILSWVYFCDENNVYKFKIVTCDTDKYRALSELNFGWSMWQASAQREGFKLVPVDPTIDMVRRADDALLNPNSDTVDIYKAMIRGVNE